MKKQTQTKRLLAYLKKHRRGITTMEAFRNLGITCVHKRIAELGVAIKKTPEKTADGARIVRYSLGR